MAWTEKSIANGGTRTAKSINLARLKIRSKITSAANCRIVQTKAVSSKADARLSPACWVKNSRSQRAVKGVHFWNRNASKLKRLSIRHFHSRGPWFTNSLRRRTWINLARHRPSSTPRFQICTIWRVMATRPWSRCLIYSRGTSGGRLNCAAICLRRLSRSRVALPPPRQRISLWRCRECFLKLPCDLFD